MKKNIIITSILFIISCSVFGQQTNKQYEFIYEQKFLDNIDTVKLALNKNCSVYFNTTHNRKNNKIKDEATGNLKLKLNSEILVLKSNRKIYSNEYILNKKYIVIDSIDVPDWKITPEQRIINGFNSFKATGNYRGRNYILWFTPEIPINNGPWKFSGLPGLIIKVQDEDNEVFFDLISLKNTDVNVCSNFHSQLKKSNSIDRKKYIVLFKKKLEAFSKFLNTTTQEKDAQIETKIKINLIEKSILEDEN